MRLQSSGHAVHLRPGKSEVLSQIDRPAWTVQFEYRLPLTFQNVDMSRAMIVRIDHDPNAAEAQNRGHEVL